MTSDTQQARPQPSQRADYARFIGLTTRWHDNDVYGHVNNVVYYAFFDTAVNQILVEEGVLDPATSRVVGLVVETRCTYFESIAFPDRIEVGVAAVHIGRSSVRYRIGVFKAGVDQAAADGMFTHVYVDRAGQKPVPIPEDLRRVMEQLLRA
jgi:acyl-CoA thioester hydrolase